MYTDSNSYNPLYLLDYTGIDIDVEVPGNYSLDETALTIKCNVSNENIVQSSFKRYKNGISDIKEVFLLLQSDLSGNQYNLVNNSGNLFQIDIGGDYFGSNANPSILYQSTNYSFQDEHWNSIRMVNPKMYSSRRYDEYFFNLNNFNSLISSNGTVNAKLANQARYPDQNYFLRARAVTLSNLQGYISPFTSAVNIDNFLPYIKKVTLSDSEGVFYEAEWTLNGSETELILNRCTYRDEITDGFEIEVETSESLNNLSISILDVNSFPLTFLNSEKTLWGASLAVNIPNNNEHTITFEGIDTAGNPLLTDPSILYHRINDTGNNSDDWSPSNPITGADTIHKINLPVNGSCACNLQAGRFVVDTMNRNQSSGLTVTGSTEICEGELTALTVSGGSGSYNWYLEGDFISDENPLNHTLPVGENNITVVDTADPCDTNSSFTVTVLDGPNANAGSDVTIQNGQSTQLQGSGGSSYSWSPTTYLSNPNIFNPQVNNPSETITYTLTVTENGCTDTDQVTVIVENGTGGNDIPDNDNCNDAETLTSSTSCSYTFGTIDFATDDGFLNDPSCDLHSNPNMFGVFYSFIAVSNTHTIMVNPTGQLDAVLTIYSGSVCTNLNEFDCEDTSGGNGLTTSLTNNNFVIGQEYWIRVYDYGSVEPSIGQGGFDICITHDNSGGGNGVDLVTNISNISDNNPDAGDQITINYTATNIGDEITPSLPTLGFFLSTNQTLSGSDDFLGVDVILQNISPNETVSKDVTITLPNVSDGQYYLVTSIDDINLIDENNEDNNIDFYPIQIGEVIEDGPDLDISGMTVTPNTGLAPNQEINVELEIDNDGNEDADNFDVLYFLDINNDGNPDANEFMREASFGAIDADDDRTRDRDMFLPSGIPAIGSYKVIAIADSNNDVNETNEDNNDKERTVNIGTITPAGPDLVVNYISVEIDATNQVISEQSLCLEEEYLFRFELENIGNLSANTGGSQMRIRCFISEDQSLDGNDISIGSRSYGTNLNVGQSVSRNEDFTITGFVTGSYYLILWADSTEIIDEINESNNFTVVPITISNCLNIPLVDLEVTIDNISPYESEFGDTLNIDITVTNNGSVDANGFTIKGLLSDDTMYHGYYSSDTYNDHRMDGAYESNVSLDAGASVPITLTGFTRNSTGIQPPISNTGIHYIFVKVDYDNDINETDKANNIASVPIYLTSVDCYYNFETTALYTGIYTWEQDYYALTIRALTEDACNWNVTSPNDWVFFPTTNFIGDDFINFTLYDNPYPFPRNGQIFVEGELFYEFTQDARPCELLDASIRMSVATANITDIDCLNQGSVLLTIHNGFPPYSYSWSTGATTQNLINITQEGEYTITVTDASDCVFEQTFTVILDNQIDTLVTQNNAELTSNQTGATYQWVDCDNGNTPIDGATNQTFIPITNGNYAVEITFNGCTELSECYNVISVSNLTYVPDDNFEQELINLGYDDMLDDYVVTNNISNITYLQLNDKNIITLTGIEDFVSLETLWCRNNQLTSLDMSHNQNLEWLLCNGNQLINLNVSQCQNLIELFCTNNQLTSLDVSQNHNLERLFCYQNQLTNLDVSQNHNLKQLLCESNQLTSLVIQNPNLEILHCRFNQLTSLDVSESPILWRLICGWNPLTNLDIASNTSLKELSCSHSQLTSLDLTNNISLNELHCSNNQLTSLDLSQNSNLEKLGCFDNYLTKLNIKNGNNTILETMRAYNNSNLTCIQVDEANDANSRICDFPSFGWCKDDIAEYTEDEVCCSDIINFTDSNFKNALLNYSPVIDTNGDSEIQICEAETVITLRFWNKGITSLNGINRFINLEQLTCTVNQLTDLNVSQNPKLKLLNCYGNQLTSLDVSQNPNLEWLICYNNQLTHLDVSQNPNLEWLQCEHNQLTSLITQNPNLEQLNCHDNQLTNLDISQNPNLKNIQCANNQLTSFDVSYNTILESLYCYNNQLTSLDISQNGNLTSLSCSNNQLTHLDIRNGNNGTLWSLKANNNPDLACIQVDNLVYANSQICYFLGFGWCKDATAEYSEYCFSLAGIIPKEELILSIKEDKTLGDNKITVYPNPTEDFLFIRFPEHLTFDESEIKLYDINGSLLGVQEFVIKNREVKIPVQNISQGVYIIRIISNQQKWSELFIKN